MPSEVQGDMLQWMQNRKDMRVLASSALKCSLTNLPGGEDASYILGHACTGDNESQKLLNGVFGNMREVKIEIEWGEK